MNLGFIRKHNFSR